MRQPDEITHNGRTVRDILSDNQPDLRGADLRGADLREAGLQGVVLRGAGLREAGLQGVVLRGADLREAGLQGAVLRGAYLQGADLRGADLQGAYLREASLREASLQGADLREASLQGASLQGAILEDATLPDYQITPDNGAFTAYKATRENILQLTIPADANRTSCLTSDKCRASKVRVDRVFDQDGQPCDDKTARGKHDSSFVYEQGTVATPDKYDDDIRVACTHGIHFFMTKEEAIEWLHRW